MAHITTTQAADAKAETRLLKLLGQTTEWLAEQRYEHGTAWLHSHFGFDSRLERALSTMPGKEGATRNLFWAWWLNDWQHRDHVMSTNLRVLHDGTAAYNRGNGVLTIVRGQPELLAHYQELHSPKNMQVVLPSFITDAAKAWLRTALPED